MPNYNNFKINSNFKTDLIVFSYSGTVNVDSNGYGGLSVNHGLSFTPLPFGLYSADGGTTWNDIDFHTQNGEGILGADSSTVGVAYYDYSANPPASILVRLFAFAPSTATNVIVNPPTPLSKFYLDSRKTHELLIASGRTVLPSYNGAQTAYTHNLGYLPRVLVWSESTYDGSVSRPHQNAKVTYSGYYNYSYPIVTTTTLSFMNYDSLSSETAIVHWRLYGGQS